MTEDEMRDYLELFWDDGIDPILSFWDDRTSNKRLLFASHDRVAVLRYIIACPVANDEQKQMAQLSLDGEGEPGRLVDQPLVKPEPFLIAEIDWNSLTAERRKELLAGCGYSTVAWKKPWDKMPPTMQVLLARELERISGGTATLEHDEVMEELRHEPGWEQRFDPRLSRPKSRRRTGTGNARAK
jgi:hypothetical protein